ncbi:MAG: tRNA dihydrouridine synthase DusB [Lachnospiraceae bacterium]|nr:tRNA dihydrouridine synthase DusB [Lachnospiraceae bacterium]
MGKLLIGDVELENNIILAPMAGVTDLPFRLLCRQQGAGLVCMEMISAKAVLYKNKNTESLLEIHPDEGPVSLQLFGSDPQIVSDIARQIETRPFSILDINMGCPMPKIVNNGEGSALMKNPKLAGEIVSAVVKAIKKPVTVKIRSGFDKEHINAVEMAKVIEDAGASAVAIHARTKEQLYAGEADWEIIAKVKDAVSIPVIGNGDVTCGESAAKMLKQTNCDAVMIGRASRGNPWLFNQIRAYLEEGVVLPNPTKEERKAMMLEHARLQLEYKGEYTGIREMRKHVSWYTAGMPHSAKLRQEINSMENFTALEELIKKI